MKTINLAIILFLLLASCGESQSKKHKKHGPFKPSTAEQQALHNIASEAAIWGTPLVGTYAIRQAFFRDAGAKYGDIVYWSNPEDWRNQMIAPNPVLKCVYFSFNCKDGPMVLEIPPTKQGIWIFGSLQNAWQARIAALGPYGLDSGKGGKYLVLPPGQGASNFQGNYFKIPCNTYNGYGMLWLIPIGYSNAALDSSLVPLKDIKLYAFGQSATATAETYIDVSDRLFDGIAYYNARFFDGLAALINEEPMARHDSQMIGQLKQLGIEKGKTFKPDSALKVLLADAAQHAHKKILDRLTAEGPLFYLNKHWRVPSSAGFQTRFTYNIGDSVDKLARGAYTFFGNAPRRRGPGDITYMVAFVDSNAEAFTGEHYYCLHVPPDVPAERFWSITVYDIQTAAYIRGAPVVSLDSYDENMKRNADGSVDIYFGVKPPPGQKFNWIATKPGGRWFAMFRLLAPEKRLYYKKWKLPDIGKYVYGKAQKK